MADFWGAVLISLIAGLSTAIGGLYSLFVKKISSNTMGALLGFSAGTMLVVSFVDLIPEALHVMEGMWNPAILLAIFFSVGAIGLMLVDLFLPHFELETITSDDVPVDSVEKSSDIAVSVERHDKMLRLGWLMVIGIAIHNLPEGIVVGASYAYQPEFGLFVGLAIMIHNIPEGVAVATALMASGQTSRGKIIGLTLMSGLAEPIGALIGAGLIVGLSPVGGAIATGFSLAFAAGVMVYVTVDELIPTAHMHVSKKHIVGIGLVIGIMFILFLSGFLPE